ncbi:hypothetical protein DVR09_15960 (plasmid) [Erythrobacter aureus]|uniref:Uncharacterized protein n=1 Tax=Erythrobacter aureus TaxID=2182384 RepID=A0A345YJ46_9SPHN|nr:hypothetical protein DVR09_15960 [Erythrobacter aureus]
MRRVGFCSDISAVSGSAVLAEKISISTSRQ